MAMSLRAGEWIVYAFRHGGLVMKLPIGGESGDDDDDVYSLSCREKHPWLTQKDACLDRIERKSWI